MQKKINIKITSIELFVFVMQIIYIASSSEISEKSFYKYIEILAYLLAGVLMLMSYIEKSINLKQLLRIILLIAFLFISIINSKTREFAFLILYWLVLKDEDSYKIIKTFLYADIAGLIGNFILALVGFYSLINENATVAMGFKNSNFVGLFIFNCIVLYYLINERKEKYIYFIQIIAFIFCWKYVKCRSASISIIVLMFFMLFSKLFKGRKIFNFCTKYAYVGMSMISIILGKIGTANLNLTLVDKLLSGRIVAWNVYFKYKPITLLGTVFYARDFYALDNAYLWLLFRYGVVIFIVYGIANIIAARRAVKEDMYNMQIVLFVTAIYSVMEFSPMSVFNNIGLALLTAKWNYNRKNR